MVRAATATPAIPPTITLHTNNRTFTIPHFSHTHAFRNIDIHTSLITTIDALCAKVLGTNARPNIDIFSPTTSQSFCAPYTLQPYDTLASFNGLYFHNLSDMGEAVALAASHKAFAIFISPILPDTPPFIQYKQNKPPIPWFNFLMLPKHLLLQIPLPHNSLTRNNQPYLPRCGLSAIIANFGPNRISKTRTRPETTIPIDIIPNWPPDRKLQPAPKMWTMPSPLPETDTTQTDTSPIIPLLPPQSQPVPLSLKSSYNIPIMTSASSDYPNTRVCEIALAAMTETYDPYTGNRSTPKLPLRIRNTSPTDNETIRAKFVDEVKGGFFAGPYEQPPYPNSTITPIGTRRKNKYVADDHPLAKQIRIVTDLSSTDHGGTSTNDLTTTPRWISSHFSAGSIRDTLAWFGKGCLVTVRDIPKCFRTLKVPGTLLFLFIYSVTTPGHGTEYFVDLCLPFGWRASEQAWEACGSIIDWALFKKGVTWLYRHVDNFFEFHGAITASEAIQVSASTDSLFADLTVPLHEQDHAVDSFMGLGWLWSTNNTSSKWPVIMTMPEDKYLAYKSWLSDWCSKKHLSNKQLDSLCGVVQFISFGLQAIRPYVASALQFKTLLKQAGRHSISIPAQVKEALSSVNNFLSNWDRRCPVVAAFGPCFPAQFRGWTDASRIMSAEHPVPCVAGFLLDPSNSSKPMAAFYHILTQTEIIQATQNEPSIPYLELLAATLWVELYGPTCNASRVLLSLDSSTASQAINKAFSENPHIMPLLRRFRSAIAKEFIVLRARAIIGDPFNDLADALTHGEFNTAKRLAWGKFGRDIRIQKL